MLSMNLFGFSSWPKTPQTGGQPIFGLRHFTKNPSWISWAVLLAVLLIISRLLIILPWFFPMWCRILLLFLSRGNAVHLFADRYPPKLIFCVAGQITLIWSPFPPTVLMTKPVRRKAFKKFITRYIAGQFATRRHTPFQHRGECRRLWRRRMNFKSRQYGIFYFFI